MHTEANDIFTREDITDEFMNEIVFCEHFYNFGFICIPAPPQLNLYLKDGTRRVIILDKTAEDDYLSPQEIKELLPSIYERFFCRNVIKEDENGIKRVKNRIIPKHYLPCMIREDLYREIVEKDANFFDKDTGSLPLAIGRYLCEKNGIDEMVCKKYKRIV